MASSRSHSRDSTRRPAPTPYWCRTLGEFALYRSDNAAVPVMHAGKPLAIVVYLGLRAGHRAARDSICDLIWPGVPATESHHSLRQAVYRLKEAAGESLLRLSGNEVELACGVRFDCLEGEKAADARDLARACGLLDGNFLDGFSIAESHEFDEWVEVQRGRFRNGWVKATSGLVEESIATGQTERALDLAEQLCIRRPFDDGPVQLLMTALVRLGRHATAVARFQGYAEQLRREQEEQPGEELRRYVREVEAFLRSRPSPPSGELPFVGRALEWAEIQALWHAACDGQAATVLIESGAGLGKSRLVSELSRAACADNGIALLAKCYEIEQAVPYAAIAQALAGAAAEDALQDLSGAWLAEAGRILPELRERFPSLPDPRPSDGIEAAKRRLHESLARYVEALAAARPVLLAVDDVHWADTTSLEALHFLSHRLRAAKVVLVATYRPAELSPAARRFVRSLAGARLARLIVLDPLDPAAIERLLELMGAFDEPGLSRAVGEHLHRHSGGSPLFLSELLTSLSRSHLLSVRDGRWDVAPEGKIADLPRTLGKLIADRIDALAPWMRAFVEALAVGAQELPVELLAGALDVSEPRAELALGVLEEEMLVRRVAPGIFELIHDELRQAVYRGVPDERRRLLHGALGHKLEQAGAAKQPGGAARIAHHFGQAGVLESAHHYSLLAASEAGALGSAEAQQEHLEVAAAHAPKALPPASSIAAGRRRRLGIGLTASAVLLLAAVGWGVVSTRARESGPADYRQGTLYFRTGSVYPSHRIVWPSPGGGAARLEALTAPLYDQAPPLLVRSIRVGDGTHSKIFSRANAIRCSSRSARVTISSTISRGHPMADSSCCCAAGGSASSTSRICSC